MIRARDEKINDGHGGKCAEDQKGDAELASLICPRPLLVEHGKQDRIGWWEYVQDEFHRARSFYERLGIPERAALALHEHGHIAEGSEALPFLDRWLKGN